MAIAQEHQVKAYRSGRGIFELIELWIDDCLLIELVTPTMSKAYRALFEPERLREVTGIGREHMPHARMLPHERIQRVVAPPAFGVIAARDLRVVQREDRAQ